MYVCMYLYSVLYSTLRKGGPPIDGTCWEMDGMGLGWVGLGWVGLRWVGVDVKVGAQFVNISLAAVNIELYRVYRVE